MCDISARRLTFLDFAQASTEMDLYSPKHTNGKRGKRNNYHKFAEKSTWLNFFQKDA